VVVAAPAAGLRRCARGLSIGFAPWTTQTCAIHERWAAATPQMPGPAKKPQGPPPVPAWMETPLDVALGQFIENVRAQTPHSRFELYSTAVSAALWTPENLPAPAVKGAPHGPGPPPAPCGGFWPAPRSMLFGRSAVPWQELESAWAMSSPAARAARISDAASTACSTAAC
jgi:hypothetical protein